MSAPGDGSDSWWLPPTDSLPPSFAINVRGRTHLDCSRMEALEWPNIGNPLFLPPTQPDPIPARVPRRIRPDDASLTRTELVLPSVVPLGQEAWRGRSLIRPAALRQAANNLPEFVLNVDVLFEAVLPAVNPPVRIVTHGRRTLPAQALAFQWLLAEPVTWMDVLDEPVPPRPLARSFAALVSVQADPIKFAIEENWMLALQPAAMPCRVVRLNTVAEASLVTIDAGLQPVLFPPWAFAVPCPPGPPRRIAGGTSSILPLQGEWVDWSVAWGLVCPGPVRPVPSRVQCPPGVLQNITEIRYGDFGWFVAAEVPEAFRQWRPLQHGLQAPLPVLIIGPGSALDWWQRESEPTRRRSPREASPAEGPVSYFEVLSPTLILSWTPQTQLPRFPHGQQGSSHAIILNQTGGETRPQPLDMAASVPPLTWEVAPAYVPRRSGPRTWLDVPGGQVVFYPIGTAGAVIVIPGPYVVTCQIYCAGAIMGQVGGE